MVDSGFDHVGVHHLADGRVPVVQFDRFTSQIFSIAADEIFSITQAKLSPHHLYDLDKPFQNIGKAYFIVAVSEGKYDAAEGQYQDLEI